MDMVMMVEILITAIALPWCIFVTVSIFNQRQEIALMKQELQNSKDIYVLLKERLS